jgi:hypothetical protein
MGQYGTFGEFAPAAFLLEGIRTGTARKAQREGQDLDERQFEARRLELAEEQRRRAALDAEHQRQFDLQHALDQQQQGRLQSDFERRRSQEDAARGYLRGQFQTMLPPGPPTPADAQSLDMMNGLPFEQAEAIYTDRYNRLMQTREGQRASAAISMGFAANQFADPMMKQIGQFLEEYAKIDPTRATGLAGQIMRENARAAARPANDPLADNRVVWSLQQTKDQRDQAGRQYAAIAGSMAPPTQEDIRLSQVTNADTGWTDFTGPDLELVEAARQRVTAWNQYQTAERALADTFEMAKVAGRPMPGAGGVATQTPAGLPPDNDDAIIAELVQRGYTDDQIEAYMRGER